MGERGCVRVDGCKREGGCERVSKWVRETVGGSGCDGRSLPPEGVGEWVRVRVGEVRVGERVCVRVLKVRDRVYYTIAIFFSPTEERIQH